MSIFVAPRPQAKAILGVGAAAMQTQPMGNWVTTGSYGREQKYMKQCTAYWKSDPWIRAAERTIAGLASTVPWHLEDANDVEVDDEYPNKAYLIPRDLLEKPQAALPPDERQPGANTRRKMWNLTIRHMGVTGNAFWYLDQLESQARTPLSILYIAPWRMTPVPDKAGNLIAWMLDYDEHSRTGTKLSLDEVLHFTLEPPEEGYFGIGLVESAMGLATLDKSTVMHATTTLGGGGRLAGIVSPKDAASTIPDDKFAQLVRDFRTINELPDAAKRLNILQGPVDFQPTAANMTELGINDLLTLSRDFILEVWGVPLSQIGGSPPAGLNSGDKGKHEEAAMWKGAIDPRLEAFRETVQFELLDRWLGLGITVELEIDAPKFDDDGPRYDLLSKSEGLAMRNEERRALINLEPLGDPAIDNAIWLPVNLVQAYLAPDTDGKPVLPDTISAMDEPPAPPVVTTVPPPMQPPQLMPGSQAKANLPPKMARLHGNLAALRKRVNRDYTDTLKASLVQYLEAQKENVARRLLSNADEIIRTKGKDPRAWFGHTERWDRELLTLLERPLTALAQGVAGHIEEAVHAKAVGVGVVDRALQRGAARVKGINERTREAIRGFIIEGLEEGLSPAELAQRLLGITLDNGTPAFDELRAETIARTELMDAYNGAALGTYLDAGLSEVQAIDGDGDEECADRDGRIFSIADAEDIIDHPNGTLDWVPVIEMPEAKAAPTELEQAFGVIRAMAERRDDQRISVEGPTIHNHPPLVPDISVPAAVVNMPEPAPPRRVRKEVVRDDTGRIVAIVETEEGAAV